MSRDTALKRLLDVITSSTGETSRELRAAPQPAEDDVPPSLSPYVDAVLRHAYRINDSDVETLRTTHSDDVIFEVTVNAAVGAGAARLERALALLKDGEA
jgi:alkylhydroperoxidase family enzyme